MRAALVEGANVEGLAVAGGVLAGDEPLLARVVQDHEGAGLRVVGREAFLDREGGVLQLDGVEVADLDRCPEAALQVRPREAKRAGGHFQEPQADPCPERGAHQLPSGQALDLLLAQRLDRLLGQGSRFVDEFDVVVAHAPWILRRVVTGRSGGLDWSRTG